MIRNRILSRGIMGMALLMLVIPIQSADSPAHPLLDWSHWGKYRANVTHPSLSIKPADLVRARKNIKHHQWAQDYADKIEKAALGYTDQLTTEFLIRMVPDTTPMSQLFTPCPACRDQEKPYHPHGTWRWSPEQSEVIKCTQCSTVYPNDKYPETVELKSTWGQPQTFSYYGGDTFPIFQWNEGRPSFTGNIRSQKILFMSHLVRQIAEAYALTNKPEYADAVKKILARLADVYPHYLVHCAYGEIADMDPRAAAFAMDKLPGPELTYPPNKPDRTLFKKFWVAGRATGVGMEGSTIRQWAEAYDLTCTATTSIGATIYSDKDRLHIEKNLLLEATILAVADPQMNNKSIGNRTAVGMVGATLGLPLMVRYGLDAFKELIDDWFLPDGGTPESISYGFMAVAGVRDLSLAFRNYSDPSGYTDDNGERIDNLELFHDSNYPKIWQAFLDCLQPDLRFPPFADSRAVTHFPATDAEIIASVYQDEPRYKSLLAALSGKDDTPPDPATAIYLRPADFQTTTTPPLTFPDHCRPDLQIGFMRTGDGGRDSLLLLSATPWGVHRHQDSLNLYYWKGGHELLTDLGYLWDHADEEMTFRTLAHNLVIIDEQDQQTRTRGGRVEMFYSGDRVKAMRASSDAYLDVKTYRRTSGVIDHGEGRSYAVDLFEVDGGKIQDFVYHGPVADADTSDIELSQSTNHIYDLENIQTGQATAPWTIKFDLAKDMQFTAWNLPQPGEQAFIASGWGQRDSRNRDRGTTIPYIIRRTTGDRPHQFASLFEGHAPDSSFVKSVKRLNLNQTNTAQETKVVLEVITTRGTDYIGWNITEPIALPGGTTMPPAPFAVVSTSDYKIRWTETATED